MKQKFILALGLVAAASFSVSAQAQDRCGMGNGKKATGEPIQIGAIVGKTGPEDFSSAARSAEAYFKCVNANGGINGRPVNYTVQDDTWNPEVASQAASKLVKDTKVVGMVGSTSFVECGANNKMYEQEGVAVIAGVGVPRACFYGKNYAAFNQGPRQSTISAAMYIADTFKLKNITCIAPGIPGFGDWVCGGVESWGKANGVNVKQVIFDPGQLDGNAIVLQAQASKPDGIVLGMPRGMMLPILTAAEQQDMGKSIKWGLPTSAYHTEMPKAAGKYWDGKLYVHMELEPLDKDGADTKNWLAVMAKYGNKKDPIDSFSQAGYLSAQVATNAMLGIKGDIDRKAFLNAARAIKNVKTDMLCAPWYFGEGERHQPNHNGRVALLTGGSFKLQTTSCFQAKDADLADVLAFEAKTGVAK